MTNSKTLSDKLNSFDFWYMMSDSHQVYRKGNEKKSKLKKQISDLSEDELLQLIPTLSKQAMEFFDIITSDSPKPTFKGRNIESENSTMDAQTETPVAAQKSSLSNIMSIAWVMVKSGSCKSISEGLRLSWKAYKLKKALREGIVYFSFIKADGKTIRNAIGTLREGNFNYQSKGNTKTKNLQILSYWDIEKNTFRSCRIDRLISIAA